MGGIEGLGGHYIRGYTECTEEHLKLNHVYANCITKEFICEIGIRACNIFYIYGQSLWRAKLGTVTLKSDIIKA